MKRCLAAGDRKRLAFFGAVLIAGFLSACYEGEIAMPKPSVSDMKTSLEDARFFYQKLEPIIRGPEQQQDLELVRRYFRAYLHCWKCIPHFVREVKGLTGKKNDQAWSAWCQQWAQGLDPTDYEVFEC